MKYVICFEWKEVEYYSFQSNLMNRRPFAKEFKKKINWGNKTKQKNVFNYVKFVYIQSQILFLTHKNTIKKKKAKEFSCNVSNFVFLFVERVKFLFDRNNPNHLFLDYSHLLI